MYHSATARTGAPTPPGPAPTAPSPSHTAATSPSVLLLLQLLLAVPFPPASVGAAAGLRERVLKEQAEAGQRAAQAQGYPYDKSPRAPSHRYPCWAQADKPLQVDPQACLQEADCLQEAERQVEVEPYMDLQ